MGIVKRNIPTANCSKIPRQVQRDQTHILTKFITAVETFVSQGPQVSF